MDLLLLQGRGFSFGLYVRERECSPLCMRLHTLLICVNTYVRACVCVCVCVSGLV